MQEIFQRIEFRPFSYEEDPESLVDMHRCREILEGSWFDAAETCRMHAKIVARTPGSSWVLSVCRMIIGHADITGLPDQNGLVLRWRLHPDYRHPVVANKLFRGLCQAAQQRQWKGLLFLADLPEVMEDLNAIGVATDRSYQWVNPAEARLDGDPVELVPVKSDGDEVQGGPWHLFLGSPLSLSFFLHRAVMGADYGVFRFAKPQVFLTTFLDQSYLACHDGREWAVFRRAASPADGEAIRPLLSALGETARGKILLSAKAIAKAEAEPINDVTIWDLFTNAL